MSLTKKEMIEYITNEARKISKEKSAKTRERKIEVAKLHLIKSTEKQVEDLYNRVKKEGAENIFK